MTPICLELIAERFAICRFGPDCDRPAWCTGGSLCAWITTTDEATAVCSEDLVSDAVECSRGWRCLQVAGPLDLSLVGILSRLTAALASAQVPVFALSTYDTDYLLVREEALGDAISALRTAGHEVGTGATEPETT